MAETDHDDTIDRQPRPTPTCCACIVRDGRILLIERAQEPNEGYWSFPGGRIEFGETVFEAVRREVHEETGLTIEPERVFQVYDWITRDDGGSVRFHYLVNYVLCRYVSGEPTARSDAADVGWFSEVDIPGLTMHPFARQTALSLLRGERP
jgi:ADP-ribose pyrophosphatase YjhB (NUDIX family)